MHKSVTLGRSLGTFHPLCLLTAFFPEALVVLAPGLEHVEIEEDHAKDDAALNEAEEVDLQLREGLCVEVDEVVDNVNLSGHAHWVQNDEGVVAEEPSDWVGLESIVEVAVDLSHRPYDHHPGQPQIANLWSHEVKGHDVATQDLEEATYDGALRPSQNDEHQVDDLEDLDEAEEVDVESEVCLREALRVEEEGAADVEEEHAPAHQIANVDSLIHFLLNTINLLLNHAPFGSYSWASHSKV